MGKSSAKPTTNKSHAPARSEPAGAAQRAPAAASSSLNPAAYARFGPSLDAAAIRLTVPAKMTVGPVGDAYEQEADAVARQVVQTIGSAASPPPPIQRAGGEDAKVQMTPLYPAISRLQRAEDELRRQAAGIGASGGPVGAPFAAAIQREKGGGGSPLAEGVRAPMERAFGADFSRVRVHADGAADTLSRTIQAKAFTTGSDVFFRSGAYQPGSQSGQELIAHELAHTIQQGGVAQAGRAQRTPANIVQRYVDAGPVRTSSGGGLVLEGPQQLFATPALIGSANAKLLNVAGGLGAYIRLQPGAAHAVNHALAAVTPEWVNNRGQQSANHKQLHTAQQDRIFKTQNDCMMTASLAAGIDDTPTGTGETNYGKYNVQNRHDKSGSMTTEASAPLDTDEMKKRQVSAPSMAGGGMPYQASMRNLYRFYMLNMPVFRDMLAEEYREGDPRHTAAEVNDIQSNVISAINQAERLAGTRVEDDRLALQMALQAYMRAYAAISQRAALYQRFSAMFGVNEAVNPEVGDALAIMNDPRERDQVAERIKARQLRGEPAGEEELWNYHFAGVVMKEEASGDFITLENAADEAHQEFNQNWGFFMYGSRAEQPGQTFQGQLRAGAHGPGIGNSPLTMAFVAGAAPKPVIEYPAANAVISDPTYTIRIRPDGSVNSVRVKIDMGDWNPARFTDGNWFFDWANYPEGQHVIKVEAWNVNGQRVELTRRVTYTRPENLPQPGVGGQAGGPRPPLARGPMPKMAFPPPPLRGGPPPNRGGGGGANPGDNP